MKIKTPEELANESGDKDKYTLYLTNSNMDEVKKLANKANTSTSKIIDEAVSAYLRALKDKKNA